MSFNPPTAPLSQRVFQLLADQQFHSGTQLAAACGVSRSAIWKAAAALRALGVTVHAVSRRGYRLPLASSPLQAPRIKSALPAHIAARLRRGATLWSTTSTNADLLTQVDLAPGRFDFLTAEYQSAGRGRRTRSWIAPPGGAICLSVSWSFQSLPPAIGTLSLAMGVCVLRALARAGVTGAALKWPNDLVAGAAKLGGILSELRAESGGPAFVVLGIGLNVALGAAVRRQIQTIGTQAADLAGLGFDSQDRNALAAALITAVIEGFLQFEHEGFSAFAHEWNAADALLGKRVRVSADCGSVDGRARGIDLEGALCLHTREGLQRFVTGDVSVRAIA
ncbi:MAG: biotin--[acetyl-CoA-carboxylase] ligase [Steroidobacteraceae bacterium]|jgi:BirA family biotin operon repressor/biotin-[acetyl-CoA-carboxylase] ligase